MEINQIVLLSAAVILVHMTLYYFLAMWLRDASVVDIGWGLGFVLLAWVLYFTNDSKDAGHSVLTLLTTIWGFRLAGHLYWRKRGKGEDWRYKQMRESWGKGYWWKSYIRIFLAQGVLMFLISTPVIIAAYNLNFPLTILGFVGVLIWLKGFYFESIGDLQLSQFLADPANKGKIMQSGLWRLTRHPNYFGEIAIWWGIFLLTAQLDYGLWTIVAPLTITFLLLKVSGVTMLEKKYDGNKDFKAYKKKTNALIPWFPKG